MSTLRFLFLSATLAFVAVPLSARFERPSEYDCRRALGNLFEEPEDIRPFFTPDDNFSPVSLPGPNDWLSYHREPGQPFEEYRDFTAHPADAAHRRIYLLPLGEFPEESAPSLEELRAYAAAFVQTEVAILPAYYPHDLEFSPRQNKHTGRRQLLTTDVMTFLAKRLPPDGACLLGITMEDLYPSPTWNFVFGQAEPEAHVGIYSLARYDPAFFGEERTAHFRDAILQRSCKVLAHETGHMFGLAHCIYYGCLLNGANHLEETDAKPQHLCPVCLRKLHFALGFDPARRYRELAGFFRAHHWYDDLDWVNRQLARQTALTAAP